LRRDRGFTYVLLLWWVAIGGFMLAAAGRSWHMDARRQADTELQWRGEQIRAALTSYSQVPVADGVRRLPLRLEDLLEDQRTGQTVRHLRRVWPDPVTRGEWGLLRQPGDGAIVGVFSLSTQRPLLAPAGIETYAAWRFDISAP
jgi:type II secretory pathway pseudopilin PulG